MFKLLLSFLFLVGTTFAGTAFLSWTDSVNPTGTSYSVYRANGSCSTTTLYSKVATNVVVKTYDDPKLMPGIYCYKVTATFNGMESGFSNSAEYTLPLAPPSALTVREK